MKITAYKIGAIFYALWGILHIVGGAVILAADATTQVAMFGSATANTEAIQDPGPIVHAALSFHAYNLMWMGLLSLVIAVVLNWKNSPTGYWINLVITGAADIGLIVFLLAPRHMAILDGIPGPTLWVLAAVFSTIGLLKARKT
ncbi:MAG: hypothetical protein O2909_10760 [Chloroflexi bacterium]|nr:hypothetical protein [Chloroflexota bacterium]MDA1219909.1 hypothetical protein [Chloroflexota bacterium]PKB57852.1 MAG: hypothetical protein BZY73_00975 [SAR202 cluster bacterium Casp-Chloro-G3]